MLLIIVIGSPQPKRTRQLVVFRRSDYLVKAHFRPGICLRCFASHSASHGCFGDGCCHFGRHEASFHGCSVDVNFHFGKAHSATDTHFAAADGDARFANRFAYHFAVYSVQHGLFVVVAAAAAGISILLRRWQPEKPQIGSSEVFMTHKKVFFGQLRRNADNSETNLK